MSMDSIREVLNSTKEKFKVKMVKKTGELWTEMRATFCTSALPKAISQQSLESATTTDLEETRFIKLGISRNSMQMEVERNGWTGQEE